MIGQRYDGVGSETARLIGRLVIVLCVLVLDVQAQERLALHVAGGGTLTTPVHPITALAGVPMNDSLLFSSLSATWQPWISFGADAELVAGKEKLRLGGRVGLTWNSMTYAATEQVPVVTESGSTYDATLQHSLRIRFATVYVQPYVRYQVAPWIAVEGGVPLHITSTSSYEQRQRFLDPAGQTFPDGTNEKLSGSGPLQRLSVIVPSLEFAVEGRIATNRQKTLLIAPRVSATIPVIPWESQSGMRTFTLNVGVGIRYRFADGNADEDDAKRDTLIVRDTITLLDGGVERDTVIYAGTVTEEYAGTDVTNVLIRHRYHRRVPKPPSILKVALRLAFETGDGAIVGTANMRIQQIQRVRRIPLIPLVVFTSTEDSLPIRYRRLLPAEAAMWQEAQICADTAVHWQYHVLNVIGSRMLRMRDASVTILAYDDGTADGAILNARRTTSIQQYLTDVFGINNARIKLNTFRGKPSEKPWVVLTDPSRTLLGPIALVDTIVDVELPRVRITPDVVSGAGVREWSLRITCDRDTLYQQHVQGALPKQFTWEIGQELEPRVAVSGNALEVVLTVCDRDSVQRSSEAARIMLGGYDDVRIPSAISIDRVEALRWLGPDDIRTLDREMFGTPRDYELISPIRGRNRKWIRHNVQEPELQVLDRMELYIKDERRP